MGITKFLAKYVMIQDGALSHWEEEREESFSGESRSIESLYAKCNGKNTVFVREVEIYRPDILDRDYIFQWFDFKFFADRTEMSGTFSNLVHFYDDPTGTWWGKPEKEIKRILESTVEVIGLPVDDFQTIYYVNDHGVKKEVHREVLQERKVYYP